MLASSLVQESIMNRRVQVRELNPNLVCVLCGGYFIDATTIVECVHSFCRACIVKHFESSKYCPICEVMVHKTKPLLSLKRDKTLQDIVYKLVPGLFAVEMSQRRQFYLDRPHYVKPDDVESGGEVSDERKSYICDDSIMLCLKYVGSECSPWYLRCPVGVTVLHLKKLILSKFGFDETRVQVEVLLNDQILDKDLTLLDIACLFPYRSKDTLEFSYVMLQIKQKADDKEDQKLDAVKKVEEVENKIETVVEKEVQLQITETGIMSVSPFDSRQGDRLLGLIDAMASAAVSPATTTAATSVSETPPVEAPPSPAVPSSTLPSTVSSPAPPTSTPPVTATPLPQNLPPAPTSTPPAAAATLPEPPPPVPPARIKDYRKKRPSNENTDHTKPKKPKDDANPLHSSFIPQDVSLKSSSVEPPNVKNHVEGQSSSGRFSNEMKEKVASPGPVWAASSSSDTKLAAMTAASSSRAVTSALPAPLAASAPRPAAVVNPSNSKDSREAGGVGADKKSQSQSVGAMASSSASSAQAKNPSPQTPQKASKHKPIRMNPEPWRPVITKEKLRPTLMSNSDEPKKPGKFFKMRNMPRFLGNPASGVKPMYSNGLPSPPPTPSTTTPPKKPEQILRIDPKTLRPFQKDEKKSPSMMLTNPFIQRDNRVMLPDPKTHPYGHFPPGFHASLPPSISLLLNPHQHFRNLKAREEAAKLCDSPDPREPRPSASHSHPAPVPSSSSSSSSVAPLPPPSLTSSSDPVHPPSDPARPSVNCA